MTLNASNISSNTNPNITSWLNSAEYLQVANELIACGHFFATQGWSSATSSNYSARLSADTFAITRTGVDKYHMSQDDIIVINSKGQILEPASEKSSAETLIHTTIYNLNPMVNAILHTHSPLGTRLSLKFADKKEIRFQGYEMQKALDHVTSHKEEVVLPILANSQDMNSFSKSVALLVNDRPLHGFLIAGHGLYTWSNDVKSARRHIEALEFLFQCLSLELQGV